MTAANASDRIVVWSDDYLDYDWGRAHPMNPVRLDLTMTLARELGLLAGIEPVRPEPAADAELLRIHAPDYLAAVRRVGAGPADRAPSSADLPYGLGSADNPIFPRMHEAASAVVGGTLAGARAIAAGQVRRAVSIGGGMHHAMRSSASGFCVYNDAAVAISWLLDHGFDRIAYVDVDVHHGDGVQAEFYSDPRVLTVSLHQHPATLWPMTGWPTEIGTGAAEGTAINLAIHPGTTDAVWLRGFDAIVPGALAAFRPQILISQCGVDTHREDPLADLSLTVDGQRAAFLAMRHLADRFTEGRWLALGGGGYGLVRVVPRAWTHLIAAALDRPVEPHPPIPPGWAEHATARAPRVELPTTMSDGGDTAFRRWDGPGATPESGVPEVDRMLTRMDAGILATRRATFGLLGLDPEDPRD